MFKNDLTFRVPMMNAAGMLGFAPDPYAAHNLFSGAGWKTLGAFVTNPISLRPRLPAAQPEVVSSPGGLLLHTGLPNPGLSAVLKKHARRWAGAPVPVIVHLMADRPEETARMVRQLEGLENVAAIELGFAPLLSMDIILMAVDMALGELPLIANLPAEQVLGLGPQVVARGAAALSIAAPRGSLPLQPGGAVISGRLYGPAYFAQTLELTRSAARLGLALLAGPGVYTREQADLALASGAQAVQLDTVLWK
jgi:dihydroorotate dehydrogenase (NAD+) catalytic subunit